MAAKDLGAKFICFKCSTKFYDLKRPEPVCPKCGADQRESPALRPPSETKRTRLAPVPKPIEPVIEPSDTEAEDEDDLDGLDDDEEVAVEED
ncbi:MAG: TIGR02300 family protein [Myxococcaceae bacterium]